MAQTDKADIQMAITAMATDEKNELQHGLTDDRQKRHSQGFS